MVEDGTGQAALQKAAQDALHDSPFRLTPFEFKPSDFVNSGYSRRLTDEAQDRYKAHLFAEGRIHHNLVLDCVFSEQELRDRGWQYDPVWDCWKPDPGHKYIAATRAVARGQE